VSNDGAGRLFPLDNDEVPLRAKLDGNGGNGWLGGATLEYDSEDLEECREWIEERDVLSSDICLCLSFLTESAAVVAFGLAPGDCESSGGHDGPSLRVS
jgi:hypothetical protein